MLKKRFLSLKINIFLSVVDTRASRNIQISENERLRVKFGSNKINFLINFLEISQKPAKISFFIGFKIISYIEKVLE